MQNFPFFVARRYLVSKKSYNVINLISYISIGGIGIGTMALIVVLSVYNGFDEFIKGMYSAFDPDFKITLAQGKTFSLNNERLQKALQLESIAYHTPVLEEAALVEYDEQQTIARMKGVGANFSQITGIDTCMITGIYSPKNGNTSYACLGSGIAYRISVNIDFQRKLRVWMPKRGKKGMLNPATAFNSQTITPTGVFNLEPEFNAEYFIVPIDFAQSILDYDSTIISHIEIQVHPDTDKDEFHELIKTTLGDQFVVKNRFQQREMLYKIMQSERWAIFMILVFILFVASFNILASLTMLIIDKKKDIATLKSMGANRKDISRIFIYEGWMITALGAFIGLILGYLILWVQLTFGLITFPGNGNFLINHYPVKIVLSDFFLVFGAVGFVGLFVTYIPARLIVSKTF